MTLLNGKGPITMHPLIALRRQLVSAQKRQRALSDSFNRLSDRNELLTYGALGSAFMVASGGPAFFEVTGIICVAAVGVQAIGMNLNLLWQTLAERKEQKLQQRLQTRQPPHQPQRPAA